MSTEETGQLRELIESIRQLTKSGENALNSQDPVWKALEIKRLRRMVRAALDLKADKVADTRMHFTFAVEFYSKIPVTSETPPDSDEVRAEAIISRIVMLDPVAGKRLVQAHVVTAIHNLRERGRWDWKAMGKAWGRDSNLETWRVEYARWLEAATS